MVLSYSGLGFGGSGCKITLDDRDYDGKAGSQLVTFLGGGSAATDGTKVDYVAQDEVGHDGKPHAFDPRVGMIGGSYGGQIQYAIAGIDPRVDTIIPFITWNDLSYSLAPNNTSFYGGVSYQTPGMLKVIWSSLFQRCWGFSDGLQGIQVDPSRILPCPNFDDRVCAAALQMTALGAPNDATMAFARHASVASFVDQIKIPTMLVQGQTDTLFNLQEAVATYRSLKAQGTPVKMVWQLGGHSGPGAKGEADLTKPDTNYEGRTVLDWFNHYLKDSPRAPSLDFTFFRDWVPYTGNATAAYGRAPAYPLAGKTKDLYMAGTTQLVEDSRDVYPGEATVIVPAAGLPTSITELSAVSQTVPISDIPGTTAAYESPALTEDLDVIGVPTLDFRVDAGLHGFTGQAGALSELVLFVKLYDIAPDGSISLQHRLISPVRIVSPDVPIHVELPGIAKRFAKGHRIALVISGGDAAYRGGNIPGPVEIVTDIGRPGVLKLPVATEGGDYGKVVGAAKPVRTCKRTAVVHIRSRYRKALRSATILVSGKRVATVRRGRKSARIVLKGKSNAPKTVRVVMRLRDGRTRTDVRHLNACLP